MAIIRTADIPDTLWNEIYYASTLFTGDSTQSRPVSVRRTVAQIEAAIKACEAKANGLEDGDREDVAWADDLREAVAVLEGYLK
jgi:hypothetical protein